MKAVMDFLHTPVIGGDVLEWVGYTASILVFMSLMMSSIVKLRVVSLIGAVIFSGYGFMRGAYSVAFVNAAIIVVNVYYLIRMSKMHDEFDILRADQESDYLKYFLDFHLKSIQKLFPKFKYEPNENLMQFYILRNAIPAALVLAKPLDSETLLITLDYALPEYRDFKLGGYLYKQKSGIFINEGYTKLQSYSYVKEQSVYLKKMGFSLVSKDGGKELYEKTLKS